MPWLCFHLSREEGFSWPQLNGTFTLPKGRSEFHYYFFANLTALPDFPCIHTNTLRAGAKRMGSLLFSGTPWQDKGQQTETETGNSIWTWWKTAFLRECVKDWNATVNSLNTGNEGFFSQYGKTVQRTFNHWSPPLPEYSSWLELWNVS